MNSGYFTYLCIFILYILLWMDWLDPFLKQMQIGKRIFVIWITFYFLFSFVTISLAGYFKLNIGLFIFPALMLCWGWGKENRENRLMIFSSFLLVGVNLFLLRYVIRLDPVLLIVEEPYLCTLIAIIFGLFLARSQKEVFLIVGSGIYLMEILFQCWSFSRGGNLNLGEGMFGDIFLLSTMAGLFLRRGFEWVMSCLSFRFHL